ncbi:MAG: radical SAM protein [Synechococcaceae cyanobacterium SM2_3_1]|nr:radical SAM protein [Synechococcaceae cyanobacterium SM2_3_1]
MSASSRFAAEQLLFTPAVPTEDAVRIIYAFPNTYAVGITSLGYQMIWSMLAVRRDVEVARLFTDLHEPLPQSPDLLGFSFSWELDYGHILTLLEDQGIPIHSHARAESDPLIFGGGPVLTANPEPFATFFDLILMGDGEGLVDELISAYQDCRSATRQQKLERLAQVQGVYVPSFYKPIYSAEGEPLASMQPLSPEIPAQIQKRTFRGNTLSASTVVTPHAAWENIYMVEVVRSCPEMCRFCLASYLTLPFRTAAIEDHLIPMVERGLLVTDRIGLLGASVTQHPQFADLLVYLNQDRFDGVRLSLASVRTATVTPELTSLLHRRGVRSITVAIESGSERLRQVINKKLPQADILQAAVAAEAGGLVAMKFYGMVGIPGETEADLEATVDIFRQLKKVAPKLRYTLGCSTFVPKAQTPFQWYGVDPKSEKKLKGLARSLGKLGIEFRPESHNWSLIQALISRGDRQVSRVLEQARGYGDSLSSYKRAFKDLRGQVPPLDYYVHSTWSDDAILPWGHLRGGLAPERLVQHRQEAAAIMDGPVPV